MADDFGAAIARWAKKAEIEQSRVVHQAVSLLVEEVTRPVSQGGHMPVETGNLRNSVAVSSLGPVTVNFRTKKFANPAEQLKTAIAGIEVGQPVWIGFRAPYAEKAEVKYGFVRLAAQKWGGIVAEAIRSKS